MLHDDFTTFEVIGHYNEPQSQQLTESAVNRLPDGTWMAICRNEKGNYHFTTSLDGRKWSVGEPMPFVPNGANSKPTFDKFGGLYYLGWQERTYIDGVGRSVFNVDISRDGKTWERKYRFESPHSFQYPTFHEHQGVVWLTVTQSDHKGSSDRIMFGKLEDVGQFASQAGQKRAPLPPFGPTGGETSRTAAVRIEQDSGVWWFRSPAGQRFLSIGANHVEPLYWQSPRNAEFVRVTYGGEIFRKDGSFDDESAPVKQWSAGVAANFKDWGFNTLGFHNPLSRSLQEAIGGYYVCHLPIPVSWGWNMKRSELAASFAKRPMDLFDDRFREQLDEVSDQLVKPRGQDPRLLGYAYTDGPPWTVEDDTDSPAFAKLTPAQKELHPWVHSLMSLPATAPGKQAWIGLLKKRHADPAKAATVYAVKTRRGTSSPPAPNGAASATARLPEPTAATSFPSSSAAGTRSARAASGGTTRSISSSATS
jgi:hypothetical protein